jgi:hypothetical protein
MPVLQGPEAMRELRNAGNDVPFVLIGMEAWNVSERISQGATGFVERYDIDEELTPALRAAFRRVTYLSRGARRSLLFRGNLHEYWNVRRSPRYESNIETEVTELDSGVQLEGTTKNVSIFGCWVDTPQTFPRGARLKLRLVRGDGEVIVLGRAVCSRPNLGMGVTFDQIVQTKDHRALAEWIVELATSDSRSGHS